MITYAPGNLSVIYYNFYQKQIFNLSSIDNFSEKDIILVVSPHPDDESIACGGVIQRAVSQKAKVYILWMTSGDGFGINSLFISKGIRISKQGMLKLGNLRMSEAKKSASLLGIPEENLLFLGFPDGGLMRTTSFNLEIPYRSKYTKVSEVPYEGTIEQKAVYNEKNLVRITTQVIKEINPTIIFSPSSSDSHPDHKATAYLIKYILNKENLNPKVYSWIIHGGVQWPLPKGYHPNLPLTPPKKVKSLNWVKFELTNLENEKKIDSIKNYKSQMMLLSNFLKAFMRHNELFIEEFVKSSESETQQVIIYH